jgi:signal transduction histidine kinase
MKRRAESLAADMGERRLSDAILRFTRNDQDTAEVLRVLTAEARNLAEADCGMFFAAPAEVSQTTSFAAAAMTGTPPPGSDRLMANFFASAAPAMPVDHAQSRSHETGQSWLVLPLVAPSDNFIGHLVIGKAGTNQFSSRHERWVAALIAHAALALDRAKLAAVEIGTRRHLGRALAIRDNFLSVASHELRNPLNSLHLRLDILKREAGLLTAAEGERFRTHVDKAAAQVSRMARLLDRLLDISRIASGRIQLDPRRYDIAAQVEQVAERFADQSAPGQIRVAAPGPAIGSWDEMRVDQVLTNLLSNAIKYGEGKPIELALLAADDFIEIAIADQGIGIAAEDQDRVFARFERVESDRSHSGFGLGLWISRQIVAAMGGVISVLSQPGQGATFTVRLPRRASVAN